MADMARSLGLMIGALLVAGCLPAQAQQPVLSSNTDYSRAGSRDLPVTCKPGDVQPFANKTMSEVFGDAWPASPVASKLSAPPEVLSSGRIVPPRGLEGQAATVVVAVLVGADGKSISSEAVCATTAAFSTAAKRALRNADYKPAVVDGTPVTSVIAVPVVFRAGKGGSIRAQHNSDGD